MSSSSRSGTTTFIQCLAGVYRPTKSPASCRALDGNLRRPDAPDGRRHGVSRDDVQVEAVVLDHEHDPVGAGRFEAAAPGGALRSGREGPAHAVEEIVPDAPVRIEARAQVDV